jgi:hypothetical protein
MVPASSMNATASGISVFFIHMHCVSVSSKRNSMPAFCASFSRFISPRARVWNVSAYSALIRCMPALSSTTGRSARAAERERKSECRKQDAHAGKRKRRGHAPPFQDTEKTLLLGFVFLRLVLLRFGLLGVGLLLGLLLGALSSPSCLSPAPFFSPFDSFFGSIAFSFFFASSFAAPACEAAIALTLTAVNTAATIRTAACSFQSPRLVVENGEA